MLDPKIFTDGSTIDSFSVLAYLSVIYLSFREQVQGVRLNALLKFEAASAKAETAIRNYGHDVR